LESRAELPLQMGWSAGQGLVWLASDDQDSDQEDATCGPSKSALLHGVPGCLLSSFHASKVDTAVLIADS
jgi:predicted ATP-grasp superfamily ATP-dependent carboligase